MPSHGRPQTLVVLSIDRCPPHPVTALALDVVAALGGRGWVIEVEIDWRTWSAGEVRDIPPPGTRRNARRPTERCQGVEGGTSRRRARPSAGRSWPIAYSLDMTEPTAGTPAEDELPQLVGAVAVESARAEFALRCMLVGLIDSQYAEIIAAGRGMEQLIDDCRLVDVQLDLDSNQKDKARALLADLKQLNTSRNRLVHSILAIDQSHGVPEGSPQFTALYSKYRRPGLSETITLEAARKVPEKVRQAGDELLLWTFSNLPAAMRQQVHPAR